MWVVFNYFNRYIERLNYAWHGSFLDLDDNYIYCLNKEYDEKIVDIYMNVVNTACTYLYKMRDIISEYNFTAEKLYEIMYFYLGPKDFLSIKECLSFTKSERDAIDTIYHSSEHCVDKKNIVKYKIDKNYFLDIGEYLNYYRYRNK